MALLDGLVAFWNFDQNTGTTASDATGNGFSTSLGNWTWTTGKINFGITPGSPTFPSVTSFANGLNLPTRALSVSIWANTNFGSSSAVVAEGVPSSSNKGLDIFSTGGSVFFDLGNGATFARISTAAPSTAFHH